VRGLAAPRYRLGHRFVGDTQSPGDRRAAHTKLFKASRLGRYPLIRRKFIRIQQGGLKGDLGNGSNSLSAVACVERDLESLLVFFDYPEAMRVGLRTTNAIERSFREVRRRTRPIGCFNNVQSCERIIYAICVYLNAKWEIAPLKEFAHKT
jgi:hypothetical protein